MTRLPAHPEMPHVALDPGTCPGANGAHGLFFNKQTFGPHAQPCKTTSTGDDQGEKGRGARLEKPRLNPRLGNSCAILAGKKGKGKTSYWLEGTL